MKMMTKIFMIVAITAGSAAHANGHGGTGKPSGAGLKETTTGCGSIAGGTWNVGGTGTCPGLGDGGTGNVGGSGIGPHSTLAYGHGSNGKDANRSPTGGHGGNGLKSDGLSKSVNPPTSNASDTFQA